MSEESLIQQLFSQIDRLVAMQNTTLSVVGTLFAIIIAVFAFFQWRINQKDQEVIIKTAKEEIVGNLINNYNLLEINENRKGLINMADQNERDHKKVHDEIYLLKQKQLELSRDLDLYEQTINYYLIIQEMIFLNGENEIGNTKRDEILELINAFKVDENSEGSRTRLAMNLFQLLMIHSEEKVDKEDFKRSFNKKSRS